MSDQSPIDFHRQIAALDPEQLSSLDRPRLEKAMAMLSELKQRATQAKFYGLFPDDGPLARHLYPKHMEFFAASKTHKELCFLAGNRVGKALRNGTCVATPTGWREIESLVPGDEVIAGDGSTTKVKGVYPQGEVGLFRFSFSSGVQIYACGEHLWKYQNPRTAKWEVGTTRRIIALAGYAPAPKDRVHFPKLSTEEPEAVLTVEPVGVGQATCIEVEHPEHLFVTEGGIVTHNSVAGAYAISCHLTGQYPHWWPGRVFKQPVRVWAAGDTYNTTRDIIQNELLGGVTSVDGKKTVDGTGMVPGKFIEHAKVSWARGVPDLIDTCKVKHKSGGFSTLGFKSYDQGRKVFQGTSQHIIWLDEEVPKDVYDECLLRTMTTRGMILLTFTPLSGLTPLVMDFLSDNMMPGKT